MVNDLIEIGVEGDPHEAAEKFLEGVAVRVRIKQTGELAWFQRLPNAAIPDREGNILRTDNGLIVIHAEGASGKLETEYCVTDGNHTFKLSSDPEVRANQLRELGAHPIALDDPQSARSWNSSTSFLGD